MKLTELLDTQLTDYIRGKVDKMLEIKMNAPEINMINRIEIINDYLERSIEDIKQSLDIILPDTDKSWNQLNEIFLSELS